MRSLADRSQKSHGAALAFHDFLRDDVLRDLPITQDLGSHGLVDVSPDMTRFDAERLHILITRHARFTGSARAAAILADWKSWCLKFRKVMPVEYRRALAEMAKTSLQAAE